MHALVDSQLRMIPAPTRETTATVTLGSGALAPLGQGSGVRASSMREQACAVWCASGRLRRRPGGQAVPKQPLGHTPLPCHIVTTQLAHTEVHAPEPPQMRMCRRVWVGGGGGARVIWERTAAATDLPPDFAQQGVQVRAIVTQGGLQLPHLHQPQPFKLVQRKWGPQAAIVQWTCTTVRILVRVCDSVNHTTQEAAARAPFPQQQQQQQQIRPPVQRPLGQGLRQTPYRSQVNALIQQQSQDGQPIGHNGSL